MATYWRRMLEGLRPGVTELYIHAALPGEEMQAVTNSWKDRAAEFELFTNDALDSRAARAQERPAHRLSGTARSAEGPRAVTASIRTLHQTSGGVPVLVAVGSLLVLLALAPLVFQRALVHVDRHRRSS